MTSEIEGMQGENGPGVEVSKAEVEDYEPMRHDDPHQGEVSQADQVGIHDEADTVVTVLLEEASDLVIEAIERRVEPVAYTPAPATETFLVHDDEPAPRHGRHTAGAADPHALMWLGTQHGYPGMLVTFTDTDTAQAWAGFDLRRRLWRVKGIALGQPMVSVRIPERFQLVSVEEAKMHGQLEEESDDNE